MATTRPNKVGSVRRKLAKMLEKAIPDSTVNPADLNSQIPIYASPHWDCCSWYGTIYIDELPIHIASWTPMKKVIKDGVQIISHSQGDIEIV